MCTASDRERGQTHSGLEQAVHRSGTDQLYTEQHITTSLSFTVQGYHSFTVSATSHSVRVFCVQRYFQIWYIGQ